MRTKFHSVLIPSSHRNFTRQDTRVSCARRVYRWLAVFSGLSVAVWSAHAATVTLHPVADVQIGQSSPSFNQGGNPTIVMGTQGPTAGQPHNRGLFRFDVSGIAPNMTVQSAQLVFQVTKIPQFAANSTFDLRRVMQPWTESGATWNTRDGSTPWATPGAAVGTDFSSTISASVAIGGVGTYTFGSSPGLVSDVQGWVNNPSSNFGWIFFSESESTAYTARHFGAREGGAIQPTLLVQFTPVPEPSAFVLAAGGALFLWFGSRRLRRTLRS